MRSMSEKLKFMDDLMSGITQTELWKTEQLQNPEILAADKALAAALSKLQGLVPEKTLNQITDAAYSYASAFETAAILYGIQVADAIHDIAARPSELSQYILDRVARSRRG